MARTNTSPLVDRGRVMDALEEQYGPEQLWQVERLSRHIFRGWLRDGRVVLATAQADGALEFRELEGAD